MEVGSPVGKYVESGEGCPVGTSISSSNEYKDVMCEGFVAIPCPAISWKINVFS